MNSNLNQTLQASPRSHMRSNSPVSNSIGNEEILNQTINGPTRPNTTYAIFKPK
jgi:hypothetical protein